LEDQESEEGRHEGWLQVLGEVENYGILKEVKSMAQVLPASQIESFERILSSIHSTL
jgi:hypothetical protein